MLITNMALKIPNDVIIRKTIKNKFVNISAGRYINYNTVDLRY